MIKKFVLIFLIAILCSYFVSAEKVAYILKVPTQPVQKYINILENMDFTVDLIDDDNLMNINFSQYSFLIVGEGILNNVNYIPVNNFPSLILNTHYLDDFHWSSSAGVLSSSGVLQVYINDPNYFITKNFSDTVNVYTISRLSYHFLPKGFRSPYLKVVASLTSDHSDAVIATAQPGTRLKDNINSNAKGVFFGIDQTNYWTSYSEQLFRNSVIWLTTDFIAPEISNIIISVTNESAKINFNTNKESNSTIFYDTDLSLDFVKSNTSFIKDHEVLLGNLKELTKYYYKIRACNKNGYCNDSSVFNFTTLDLTPPSLVSQTTLNLTNSSINLSIITNENSNLTVFYGIDKNILNNKITNPSFSNISTVYLSNLIENTLYYYKIKTCDIYTNCINSSLFNFTTLDFTPPNEPKNLSLEVLNNNQIKIKWDAPAGETINRYNIYISNSTIPNLNSFNFNSPNAYTSSKEYIDSNATLANKRYYIVRAQDATGNEEKNENIVAKFDINLDIGYNLISFPLIPFDSDVNKVMHQSAIYKPVLEIKKYDNINKGFKIITYNSITNQWNTLADFNELKTLDGYFFRSNQKTNFTIVGYIPSQITLNLVNGMNLVGLTVFENKNIQDVIIQSPADYNITEIVSRNNNGSYDIATYYGANGWFMINAFDIKNGVGYWLKANKNFDLTIEP